MNTHEEHITHRLIVLKAQGSFVFKDDIRQALSIPHTSAWRDEINLMQRTVEDFDSQYHQYKQSKRIPTELARLIIETILQRCGDTFELKFSYPAMSEQ